MLRTVIAIAVAVVAAAPTLAQPLLVEMLAGSTTGGGYHDGLFSAPRALATDAAGNVYVADTGNHAIRKIDIHRSVTTVAGLPGAPGGYADGVATLARFRFPAGIAVDPTSGAIYVSDKDNHVIRRITPDGLVTTIAGEPGVAGTADAQGTAAKFAYPRGLVVAANGIIYVADAGNHAIRRVTPDGIVTTFAGRVRFAGSADGTGTEATFNEPSDIALDPTTGNFYVADAGSSRIRRITPAGVVTTVAGSFAGSRDGTGSGAAFRQPWGLDVDAAGIVWITDTGNDALRRMTPTGVVTTVPAGGSFLSGVAVGPDNAVFLSEAGNHIVTRFANGVRTLYAGSAPSFGSDTSFITGGSFGYPADVAVDAAGNLYVAQPGAIRRITPQGQISVLANSSGNLAGVATGPDGSVYFTNHSNNLVLRVDPSGTTSNLASVPRPHGIAVDTSGFVYVSSDDHKIRVIAPNGGVSVLAGGLIGYFDGIGDKARFNYPSHLEVDTSGNVYVADWGNNVIRRITPAGEVSTIARDIFGPNGLTRDSGGNLYVSDYNHTISRVASNGIVTVVAGLPGSPGNATGVGTEARFFYPAGLTIDALGRVIIADEYNHAIKIGRVFTGTNRRHSARR